MSGRKQTAFGEFRFDAANECLWRGSRAIPLRPKPFAVLKYLVERPGQLVVKQDLLDAIWPDTFVGDGVLKDCIRQLRDALNDDAGAPRYIETAHRRGYRFIAPISAEELQTAPAIERAQTPASAEAPAHRDAVPATAPITPQAPRVLGREGSLQALRDCLTQASRGERKVVFVTGEPGIGKTALVESFLEQTTATRSVLATRGQCLEQYGAGEAYLPVLDALTRLCRTAGGTRVFDLLRQHAPTWLAQMPSLVPAHARESLRQETLGATRERMLREIAEAMDALASDTPLVLVLEDLHWSDYSTLDFISYLARRRDPARLMVIGTYRPVDVILSEHPLKGVKRELQAHGFCRELPLEYLSEPTVAHYLTLRFPTHEFPAFLARVIHRRTEGNPLFMHNLVSYLQDEQVIVERDGHWQLSGSLSDVERGVPGNIRQLIEKQIERLGPDEQRVLEGASVVGMECSTVAIAAGLDADLSWVEARCEELVRRHQFLLPARLVELPDGTITPRYQFVHVLYLEVPYGRIPAMRRAEIHRRISQAGEAIYGARVTEIAAELAMHFEQARVWPRAATYLLMAAQNAMQRFAHHEAAALARRGLEALAKLPDDLERVQQEIALRTILGISLMAVKGYADPEVESVYLAAHALCEGRSASAEQFTIIWSLGLLYYFRADIRKATAFAEQLLELGTALQNPALIMEAHRALGVVFLEAADFDNARQHLVETSTLYLRTPQHPHMLATAHDTLVVSHCYLARALWAQGAPDQALESINTGVRLAEQHPHRESRVIAAYFCAHVHQLRREAQATRDRAEGLIALAEEYGLELWKSYGLIHRGWSMAEQGDVDAGIDQMRRGLSTYEKTGARLWRPHYLGLLAEALAKGGQLDEAIAVITEALTASHDTGELYSQAELYRIKGELLIAKAVTPTVPPDAAACFDQALLITRAQRAHAWELRAAMSLARVSRGRQEQTKARVMIRETLDRFIDGFDTVDVTDAKALS
jgi:DNA-binding winged helix-turn-helix (wHTH) protein/predicted ATPase